MVQTDGENEGAPGNRGIISEAASFVFPQVTILGVVARGDSPSAEAGAAVVYGRGRDYPEIAVIKHPRAVSLGILDAEKFAFNHPLPRSCLLFGLMKNKRSSSWYGYIEQWVLAIETSVESTRSLSG